MAAITPGRRLIPLTCEDIYRVACEQAHLILPNEIHTTSDQHRIFVAGRDFASYHAGMVWHGKIPSEERMLELTDIESDNKSERGVFPGDMCLRTDLSSIWMCITNRGETIDDWIEFPGVSGSDIADLVDGNADVDADIIDGNRDDEDEIISGSPDI